MATPRGKTPGALLTVVLVLLVLPEIAAINQEYYRGDEVPQAASPSPPPTPKSSPCKKTKVATIRDVKSQLLMPTSKFKFTGNDVIKDYQNVVEQNCTDDSGDGTSSEPIMYDHWKLHIIMACTVTAAVEFVLIIFIILYWRQIRWTLRKITCPCDNCREQRHEQMEAGEDEETDNELDFGTIEMGSRVHSDRLRPPSDHPSTSRPHDCPGRPDGSDRVQRYNTPRGSRVTSAVDDGPDQAIAGPSGLSACLHHSSPTPFRSIARTYSSEDSLSDLETTAPMSPSTRAVSRGYVKGTRGKSTRPEPRSVHSGSRESVRSDLALLHTGQNVRGQAGQTLGALDVFYSKCVPHIGIGAHKAKSEANLMLARMPTVSQKKAESAQHVYSLIYDQEPGDFQSSCDTENIALGNQHATSTPQLASYCKMHSSCDPQHANTAMYKSCDFQCDEITPSEGGVGQTSDRLCRGNSSAASTAANCNRGDTFDESCRPPSDHDEHCWIHTVADVHRTPDGCPGTLLSLPATSNEHITADIATQDTSLRGPT